MATAELTRPEVGASVKAPEEQCFLLRDIDWSTYKEFCRILPDRHLRLTYDGYNLEIMTVSRLHARLSRLLCRLIGTLTDELGMPLGSYGDMTLDREDLPRALQPDECFYFENDAVIRAKEQLDLSVDPPPDLAVEIDISSSSRDRMKIYAALGVPEVWRFDGNRLEVYHRSDEGQYVLAEHSRYFSVVPIDELASFLRRRDEMDENSLVRLFRAWVRDQLARGWKSA